LLTGIAERGIRMKKFADYYILSLMLLSTVIVTMFFWFVEGIQYTLILPIFISVIYYQRSKIYFVYFSALSIFLLLYAFHDNLRSEIDYSSAIVTVLLFTICAILAYTIMGRGLELLINLQSSMEERQQLLVDNVIKDRMMKIDGLTQLYNRRSFQHYLESLITEADRGHFSFALSLIDVDNFKSINDMFGHWVGDIVLQRVAECVMNSVGPNDFVCRYGGEELAVIYIIDGRDLSALMENLRANIEGMDIEEIEGRRITVSTGAAVYAKGQGIELLVRETDALLYEAKNEGKNRIKVKASKQTDNLSQAN
jgi:diguanylate cyclase (GGDEF)-like protein